MTEVPVPFNALVGVTIIDVRGLHDGSEEVEFECSDGQTFKMYHVEDCCEDVCLAEIVGDVDDIIGVPVLRAEEATSEGKIENDLYHANDSYEKAQAVRRKLSGQDNPERYADSSQTWTFYKIDTAKGDLVLRWFGTSNGYYSESVDFFRSAP